LGRPPGGRARFPVGFPVGFTVGFPAAVAHGID
jgi:hypothetical protein